MCRRIRITQNKESLPESNDALCHLNYSLTQENEFQFTYPIPPRTLSTMGHKKNTEMKLVIKELSKKYSNGVKAIDHLSLEIGRGMFGLLGPNGAGKSSLMRTISTLQTPDSGSLSFFDIDILADPMGLRKVLGYLPQDFGVYPNTSAESLLHYFASLKGISSKKDRNIMVHKVLELTNLYEARNKSVSGYSGGMKQRFGIAQLLLNNPKLLIVDEPTAGLDPAERNRFLNVLREVGTESTVIFSTHIVEDVKELCTDMAIMNKGRILQHLKPSLATERLNGKIWIKKIVNDDLQKYKSTHEVLSSSFNEDNTLMIRVFSDEVPDDQFKSSAPNLEDVYFSVLNSHTKN